MSMNLCSEPRLELIQTPTWITYLLLSLNKDGEPDGGPNGVMRRYALWLRYLAQEAINNNQDHISAKRYERLAGQIEGKDFSTFKFFAI